MRIRYEVDMLSKKKAVVVGVVILIVLIGAVCYFSIEDYDTIDYQISAEILSLPEEYDYQYVDYDVEKLDFSIDEDTAYEVGTAIFSATLKDSFAKSGIAVNSDIIRKNVGFRISKNETQGEEWKITAKVKRFTLFSNSYGLWHTLIVEAMGDEGGEIVLSRENCSVRSLKINGVDTKFVIDEECAASISAAVIASNYASGNKKLYYKNTHAKVFNAEITGEDGSLNDAFYQVHLSPRVDLPSLVGLQDDKLLNNEKLINVLKYKYQVRINNETGEIIGIWRT